MKTRTLYLIEMGTIFSTVVAIAGVLGYHHCESKNKERRVDIIKQNSEIMKSIATVAITQSAVTDALMRVNHYTDRHEEGGNYMCPECSGREFVFDEIEDDEIDNLEPTHKNIMKDLRQIESGIDAFVFGHLLQIKKLEFIIKTEKEKNWQENFFDGVELPPPPSIE
jgi:hypothetical protein